MQCLRAICLTYVEAIIFPPEAVEEEMSVDLVVVSNEEYVRCHIIHLPIAIVHVQIDAINISDVPN